MADNVFGEIKSLADSNTKWIGTSKNLMNNLIEGINEHLDSIECVIKNVEKSGCELSDLQNIYAILLNLYQEIINLMIKINETSKSENEIYVKMCNKEFQKYKDIFEVLEHTDANSQI